MVRTFLLFGCMAAVLGVLYSMTGTPPAPPEGTTVINVWHPWAGDQGEEFRRLVEVFNQGN